MFINITWFHSIQKYHMCTDKEKSEFCPKGVDDYCALPGRNEIFLTHQEFI